MPFLSHNINFAHWRAEDLHPESFDRGEFSFRSPALQSLSRHLSLQQKANVLDFGPLLRENIEFLSSYHCKIFIEDFHESVVSPANVPSEALDAVLCWDMFNYLERGRARDLIASVSRQMRVGGLLILYTASRSFVPRDPLQFRIVEDDLVRCQNRSTESDCRGAVTPRALLEFMSGWRLVRSLHLRNSMQEHLCLFEGTPM